MNFGAIWSSPTSRECSPSGQPRSVEVLRPFAAVDLLRAMGVNTVSLANNHALDMGEEAYRQTALRLQENGIWVAGAKGAE